MSLELKWSHILEYTDKNVIDYTKDIAGIYRLSFKVPDKKIVFYVGQAEEIQTRLLQHRQDSESSECIKNMVMRNKCFFRFAYLKNQDDRDCSESYLYDYYAPRCNLKKPTSEPCVINLT